MLQRFILARCGKTFPFIVITLALIAGPRAQGAEQIRVGYGSLSTSYAAIWVDAILLKQARLARQPPPACP